MRGIVTTRVDTTLIQDRSTPSAYLDDAPISIQTANADLGVYDLERIEVIRGPQGALYGAGSMAGTIGLIARKPDTRVFSGSGDASVSNTQHGGTNYSVRGVANLPSISDQLTVRVAGYRSKDSGYIDNVRLNLRDASDAETTQGRAALRWTPESDLVVDVGATFAALTSIGSYDIYQSSAGIGTSP